MSLPVEQAPLTLHPSKLIPKLQSKTLLSVSLINDSISEASLKVKGEETKFFIFLLLLMPNRWL
ncbi:MAG: hypothetical protein ABSA75_07375 [Candidatus Bathyarchaeia archaeon]